MNGQWDGLLTVMTIEKSERVQLQIWWTRWTQRELRGPRQPEKGRREEEREGRGREEGKERKIKSLYAIVTHKYTQEK